MRTKLSLSAADNEIFVDKVCDTDWSAVDAAEIVRIFFNFQNFTFCKVIGVRLVMCVIVTQTQKLVGEKNWKLVHICNAFDEKKTKITLLVIAHFYVNFMVQLMLLWLTQHLLMRMLYCGCLSHSLYCF